MGEIVEMAKFKLKSDVKDEDFLQAAENVQRDFLVQFKGLVSRELLKDENGEWTDLLHWTNAEDAKRAAEQFMSSPATKRFEGMIDPSTANMSHTTVIKKF